MIPVIVTDDEMRIQSLNLLNVFPNRTSNQYPTRLETIREVEEEALPNNTCMRGPPAQVQPRAAAKSREEINKHDPCFDDVSIRPCPYCSSRL